MFIGVGLSLLVGITSCTQSAPEPVLTADFTYSAQVGTDYPVSVTLVNTSPQIDSVTWDLGNGIHTKNLSPITSYSSGKAVTVTLTVYKGSQKAVLSKKINLPFRQLSVAVVYLIPKSGVVNDTLLTAIKSQVPVIQQWYKQQTGKTFVLNEPLVDTLRSQYDAWTINGSAEENGFLADVETEIWAKFLYRLQPDAQIVLVFSPIITTRFNGVGHASNGRRTAVVTGYACQNLLKGATVNKGLWVIAHELGHALSLSHHLEAGSLMYGAVDASGYLPPGTDIPIFPACYLTDQDQRILASSTFLF